MNNLGRRAREREDRMHVSQQKKTELLFSYFITVQKCRAALLYYLLSPLCELENFPNCAKTMTVQNVFAIQQTDQIEANKMLQ